jgi:hypothetical protein
VWHSEPCYVCICSSAHLVCLYSVAWKEFNIICWHVSMLAVALPTPHCRVSHVVLLISLQVY